MTYIAPKGITNHPGVLNCIEDQDGDSACKHEVHLKHEWRFENGWGQDEKLLWFETVAEFKAANPVRKTKEWLIQNAATTKEFEDRQQRAPKGITNHPGVSTCFVTHPDLLKSKYEVTLKDGWRFENGWGHDGDSEGFETVEKFKTANPIRKTKEWYLQDAVETKEAEINEHEERQQKDREIEKYKNLKVDLKVWAFVFIIPSILIIYFFY